jgi:hypothetical protein
MNPTVVSVEMRKLEECLVVSESVQTSARR